MRVFSHRGPRVRPIAAPSSAARPAAFSRVAPGSGGFGAWPALLAWALLGIFTLSFGAGAQAQSLNLSPPSPTFIEGNPNALTFQVDLRSTTQNTQPVTVNVFYELPPGAANRRLADTVVFAPGEAGTSKTALVTAGNDAVQGNRAIAVVAVSSSGDAAFDGLTDTENGTQVDPHALLLTEISDRTNESDQQRGTRAFFDVSLRDANDAGTDDVVPTSNVFVTLASQDPDEALIATDAQPIFRTQQVLVFTPANYNQPQRVYVQGVDDTLVDGDQLFEVQVTDITSRDTEYDDLGGAVGQQVVGVNTDNEANPDDGAGVDIQPTSIETNENGATATFSVVLLRQPIADVVINLQTSDPGEGKILDMGVPVTSTSLTFSPDPNAANAWNIRQLVTIQGQDDPGGIPVADGDINYRIITTTSTTDPTYAAIDPADVGAINRDNETPGLTITPNFVVSYEGQNTIVRAVLNRAPTATVRFGLSVDDPTEVRLNRSEIVFDPTNFRTPQDIVVSGVDDNIIDGDRPFRIIVANAVSSDPNYNGNFGTTVNGVNIDTDKAIVNIQPPGGLETTEQGGTATFQVSLATMPQPGTTVTISLASSDTTEGTVSPTTLTFNQSNFNVPQTVTVRGVDDLLIDGDQDYQINLTIATGAGTDPDYALVQLQPVTVVNHDDGEVAGITVTPSTNLVTSEDGTAQTLTVSLNSQPTANVTLQVRSSNPNEGVVTPGVLTFTPSNFDTAQVVTVTGRDDAIDDGNVQYQVIFDPLSSGDPAYRFNPPDLPVLNIDDDTRGITITPVSGLTTTEAGGRATFHVALDTEPTADVTLNLTTTALREVTFTPAQITFTAANPPAGAPANVVRWDRGLDVTVSGLDDTVVDGDKAWSIDTAPLVSADPVYNGLNPPNVTGTNLDNDAAGITLNPQFLVVTEGQTATFTITLNAKPSANVTIPLSVDDATEARLQQTQVVFTPNNFNVPQTVRVDGINDFMADGNRPIVINVGPAISSDLNYNGNFQTPLPGTVIDASIQPGLTIIGPDPNETDESGLSATFSVVLNTQPSFNVTVNLRSDNTSEGVVTPARLTFTPLDWNVPQAVTVTGRDDAIDDGDIAYNVVIDPLISADPGYSGLDPRDIPLVNVDDDTRGIIVDPISGLTTSEDGGSDTFHVTLTSQPLSNVTINLVNRAPGEVSLPFTQIVLTPGNPPGGSPNNMGRWDRGVDVTVTGVDDALLDGNKPWSIDTLTTSGVVDPLYNGLNPANVTGTNQDNDAPGITIRPDFVVVAEGTTVTFTVVLNTRPSANVVLPLSVDDASEVILDRREVTFTPNTFNVPQPVRVTGINDFVVDGDTPFQITLGPPLTADANYRALTAIFVNGVCRDVGVRPGITVSSPDTTETTEAGDAANFTVVLNTQPTSNVVINLRSDNPNEGVVTPLRLAFTPLNWDQPQAVTVTGRDDAIDDGNVPYHVVIDPASSADPVYSGINPADIALTNLDDDVRGIVVDPASGLTTTEAGGTATFHVRLQTQPLANVTLDMSTTATREISFSPAQIVFTPGNPPGGSATNVVRWDRGLDVVVTGLDDTVVDGDRPWTIVTEPLVSADPLYSGLNPANVTGVNQDNDAPGLTVTPNFIVVTEGSSTTFTVVLNARPTSGVTLPLSVDDASEVRLNKTQLVFTAANWNVPQTVVVTGINDNIVDGNTPFQITLGPALSADTGYNGNFQTLINGVCIDAAARPGVVFGPLDTTQTDEGGGAATFTLALNTQPSANVIINLHSDNASEGVVTPPRLTFTPLNWDQPQIVTVTGRDDPIDDGDIAYTVVIDPLVSTDPDYNGLNPRDIPLTNLDDDTRGITVDPSSGLQTTEAGGAATFHVSLNSQPLANVTLNLVSRAPNEVSVSPTQVVFTSGNPPAGSGPNVVRWDIGRDVTVTGLDDALLDGNKDWSVETQPLISADPLYNGLNPANVTGVNRDDDAPGITVNPDFIIVSEGGTTSFTVVLNVKPTANVAVPLRVSDASEVSLDRTELNFTPNNFNVPKTVVVTGLNDNQADGDQPFQITLGPPISIDPNYRNLPAVTVDGICRDAGVRPGITVTAPDRTQTTEDGTQTATFTVVLNTQPTANVTINVHSDDTSEGVATPVRLTFTPLNFDQPQVVTVTGRDDAEDDGNKTYNVILDPSVSTDPRYNGIDPRDQTFTNIDDDTHGIVVTPTSGLTTSEDGTTATFHVSLTSQPRATVTLSMSTAATREISFAPTQIVFTPTTPAAGSASNMVRWDRGLDVVVTGLNDAFSDGNRPWSIDTAPLVSADPLYNGLNPANVTGVNLDDDQPALIFSPRILVTTEGQSTSWAAHLTVRPTANVRFALSVDRPDEVTLSQNFLLFTPDNFNINQRITLTGVPDGVRDGDQPFELRIANAVSSDPAYSGLPGAVVPGTNIDVNAVGVAVTGVPSSGLTTTERGESATFEVALRSRPRTGDVVVINVTSSDTTEGRVSPSTLTFNENNWDTPKTVTVTGQDDLLEDGDRPYRINLTIDQANTTDPDYLSVVIASVPAVNVDNDAPGVTTSPSSGLVTTEAGGRATFTVALNTRPTAGVTVTIRSSDPTEGRLVDPATDAADTDNSLTLNFTPNTFNTAQTVTVQGVDDFVDDGNKAYRVDFSFNSSDPKYGSTLSVPGVRLTNQDDDTRGVTITPASGLRVSESGTFDTFTVVLTTRPTANVDITLTSSDVGEAKVNISQITFTPSTPTIADTATHRYARWDQPVRVRVTGVPDHVPDGDQVFTIVTTLTSTSDYRNINPVDVRGTNTDVDVPRIIVVSPSRGVLTAEDGKVKSVIHIRLNTLPTANVRIPLSISDVTEAQLVDPATGNRDPDNNVVLVFTPTNGTTFQDVTIVGVSDDIEDGDQPYLVIIGKAISADDNYGGRDPADLSATNLDRTDKTKPVVTITSPANNAAVQNLLMVTGTADDPPSPVNGIARGVGRVQVRLGRLDDPNTEGIDESGFLNPITHQFERPFDKTKHLITATYNPVTKVWTLNLSAAIGGATPQLASGKYFLRASATDKAGPTLDEGNVGVSEVVNFTVDTVAPATVTITSPRNNAVLTTLPEARGFAIDNTGGSGIERVRVIVFRYADAGLGNTQGFLAQDGTFNTTFNASLNLLATVEDPDSNLTDARFDFIFQFSPPLGPGRYYIQAQADDKAGNAARSTRITFFIRNTTGGTPDFLAGQTYLMSLPYMDSNARQATTTPDKAFSVAMFDPQTNEQRYTLSRFDAATQTYVFLAPTDLMKRGEGYFIRPITTSVRILRPADDPTRVPLPATVTTFDILLLRNASADPSDPNNGFNLIGNPFNPDAFIAADWSNATVEYNGVTYQTVQEAAAAGIVDSRLFTFNQNTGQFEPVTGNMETFKGYFVRTFFDGVKVTLKAVSATP